MEEFGKVCFGVACGLLVSIPLIIWSLTPSKTLVDYRIEEILSRYHLSNPDEKLRCGTELVAFIGRIENRLERDVYAARAAEKLGVSADSMKAEAERSFRQS